MLPEIARIVTDVGELLLQWGTSDLVEGSWEGSQFKTCADLAAHQELVMRLSNLLPDVPIISEEKQSSWVDMRPERYWLIDPIDGTASFAQGYSGYVTQIALMVEQRPALAAIYAPALRCLYVAERGRGAFLNGIKLSSERTFPPKTLIDNYPEPWGIALRAYTDLHFAHYIECGSISLKICKVADGTADLFFKDVAVHDWDLAAPQLVLEEAGGFLTDIRGRKIQYADNYAKTGVVAASHLDSIETLVQWYDNLSRSEDS
jgi:3'(2'), 5'-bisphosphate nucleotidase